MYLYFLFCFLTCETFVDQFFMRQLFNCCHLSIPGGNIRSICLICYSATSIPDAFVVSKFHSRRVLGNCRTLSFLLTFQWLDFAKWCIREIYVICRIGWFFLQILFRIVTLPTEGPQLTLFRERLYVYEMIMVNF